MSILRAILHVTPTAAPTAKELIIYDAFRRSISPYFTCPLKSTQEFLRTLYDVINHGHGNDIPEIEIMFLWKLLIMEKIRTKASLITRDTPAEQLDLFLHILTGVRFSLPAFWDTDFVRIDFTHSSLV